MNDSIITWNVQNFVTISLMLIILGVVFMGASKAFKGKFSND